MKYFREMWDEVNREDLRFEISKREAVKLLARRYVDVNLCIENEGYYRLMNGGIEVVKE